MYRPDFATLNLGALDGARGLALRVVTSLGCFQRGSSHRCLFAVWQLYCCEGRSIEATAEALL